jgi:hypothetical protein
MKNNIEDLFDKLHSSGSEEEVIKNLKSIIKSFNVSTYKEKIMSNPYFSLLIVDIKGDILFEIGLIRDNIELEIRGIDDTLSKPINVNDFNRLKDLKRECMGLLYEINDRINDLILL